MSPPLDIGGDAGSAIVAPLRAALQPISGTGFTAPLAAWAIDANAGSFAERGGNTALNLTRNGVSMPIGPDIISGTSFYSRMTAYGFPNMGTLAAALQLTGAMSIVVRAFRNVDNATGVGLLSSGVSGSTSSIPYYLGVNSGNKLIWYFESGSNPPSQTANTLTSTISCPIGSWEVFHVRRNAAGRVRIGVGTSFQDLANVVQPIAVGAMQLYVGRNGAGTENWNGGIKDLAIWNSEISDVEVLARRRIMLGLAA